MALPATDSFTTADSDKALTTYSASWSVVNGAFLVLQATDDVRSNSADTETMARWSADSFNADQYAQVVSTAVSDGQEGVAVRCSDSAHTGYGYYGAGSDSYLWRESGGSWTQLGDAGAAWVTTHTYRIEVSGTSPNNSVRPMKDGATADIGTQTDGTAINSGWAGLSGYSNSTGTRVDDWEGGNLAEGPTPISSSDSGKAGLSEAVWSTSIGAAADTARQGRAELIWSSAAASAGDASRTGQIDGVSSASTGSSGETVPLGTISLPSIALAQIADSLGVTVAEAADLISAVVSAADTVGLVLDEAPAIAGVLEIADTLGLILAETGAATDVTVTGVPTYRIGMDDLTALLTILVRSADAWSVGTTDAVSLVSVILTLAEEAGVGLTDVASLQAILSLADELGIHYAEAATAVEPGGTLLSADTLPLGLTEITDLIAAVSSAAETLQLGLADTADTLTALLQNQEAISLSVDEPVSIFAVLDLADSLGLTLADLATLVELGQIVSSSDTLTVGLTDLASLISAILDTADTLGVGTAEAASILATVLAAAETIGVHLAEAPLIAAVLSLADELGIHLTELATVTEPPVFLTSADVAAVGLTDLVGALSAAVYAADALTLGLTDAVGLITMLAETADTIGLSLDDALGIFLTTVTTAVDSGALGQADAAAIALGTLREIGEALTVGADETVRGVFSILPHEGLTVGLTEAVSEMAATLAAGDTITAALLEQPSVLALLQLPADDTLRIGYAETTVAGEIGVYRVGHVIVATVTCWLEDRTCEAVVAAHTVSSLLPDYTVEDLECAA